MSRKVYVVGFTHFFAVYMRKRQIRLLFLITDRICTENLNLGRTKCIH